MIGLVTARDDIRLHRSDGIDNWFRWVCKGSQAALRIGDSDDCFILHRMWRDGTDFIWSSKGAAT
jgi:hypothetical protein